MRLGSVRHHHFDELLVIYLSIAVDVRFAYHFVDLFVGQLLAQLLGWPQATFSSKLELKDGNKTASCVRETSCAREIDPIDARASPRKPRLAMCSRSSGWASPVQLAT